MNDNHYAEPAMPLLLAATRIRQDAQGRYCLNDLHKAAVAQGANKRSKEPAEFFKSKRTQELLSLLKQDGATQIACNALDTETTGNLRSLFEPVSTVEGRDGGTYVCIQLVIAYGQFVSAAFDLRVINTFLAVIHKQETMPRIQSEKFWNLLRPHWAAIAQLALAGWRNKAIAPQVQRSPGSVGACLRRMYDVGYLNPVHVYTARLKPSTAARWALQKPIAAQWGLPCAGAAANHAQSTFDFAGMAA